VTKIIGFSGRLKSGKTTASNFVYGLGISDVLVKDVPLVESFKINDDGKLELNSHGMTKEFDPRLEQDLVKAYGLDSQVKIYAFADSLKEICIFVLGLSYEQVYTEAGKDKETHLKWDDMPGVITDATLCTKLEERGFKKNMAEWRILLLPDKAGQYMTGREVLQFVGTDIFRRMYGPCWINSTLKKIQYEQPEWAIIEDVRFPNEVFGIKDGGGKVIRFTRYVPSTKDKHDSETALDPENFDYSNFDHVLDNQNMTIPEQCSALL
jgi:hypothetical protein